jgi:ABC-type multidrug transport system ATPase subunit
MLKVSNISKSYNSFEALKDVSLNVGKGELFGLIGPDGAGKTSLFRIIATLILPDNGQVSINDHDVVNDYDYVRSNIGYMPGKFSLYQDLSVRENLDFFATIMNSSLDENRYLIDDIYKQLEPFEKRKAGALSGGMKQKLALCCALIHKPLLLLLDEPTTGVDAVSRKEFWQMLKSLKEFGISMLVSTPYMDESTLCDRVALIQEGRIMDIDSPAGVVSKFPRIVYELKGKDLYKMLKPLRDLGQVNQAYPFGDSLHIYTDTEMDLKQIIQENKFGFDVAIQRIEPDIEDVFMNLMAGRES